MALVSAKCPECGKVIEVDNEKRLEICLHCGQPFVIEEAIETFDNYNAEINTVADNDNTCMEIYGDFPAVVRKKDDNDYKEIIVNIPADGHKVSEDNSKEISEAFVIVDGVLKKYLGTDSHVVIPDGVTTIGAGAFYECTSLTSLTIPHSVNSIKLCAFSRCENLTSVTIPGSVTRIGDEAFSCCKNLTSVTIPDSVTSIGIGAFSGCENLTSVIIPDGLTLVAEDVFKNTRYLNRLKEQVLTTDATVVAENVVDSSKKSENTTSTISDVSSVNATGSSPIKPMQFQTGRFEKTTSGTEKKFTKPKKLGKIAKALLIINIILCVASVAVAGYIFWDSGVFNIFSPQINIVLIGVFVVNIASILTILFRNKSKILMIINIILCVLSGGVFVWRFYVYEFSIIDMLYYGWVLEIGCIVILVINFITLFINLIRNIIISVLKKVK